MPTATAHHQAQTAAWNSAPVSNHTAATAAAHQQDVDDWDDDWDDDDDDNSSTTDAPAVSFPSFSFLLGQVRVMQL